MLEFLWITSSFAQTQTCPVNINFADRDLSAWSAETGLMSGAVQHYPGSNAGTTSIPEYSLSTTGIQVITSSTTDLYGGFPTIPTINGYAYHYSVKIGSTATSWDLHSGQSNPGGFRRSITYVINVPAGPASVPYTMTYAYAMVLENGTHNSNDQPLFKATLSTSNEIIKCASPEYYLPTFNDAGGGLGGGSTGATLDTATALANGFTLSPVSFLSHAGRNQNNGEGTLLQDVWTKGWREVTFDLSPYRGQVVTLTFEADNCVPGAHFAYAYVALRNSCAGLEISGNVAACANSPQTYSVPALASASYEWSVPPGWTVRSGSNTNTVSVMAGTTGGFIIVHEKNGCADLRDTLLVTTTPPTVAGRMTGSATVCAGTPVQLTLQGQTGNVVGWLSSPDGTTWSTLPNATGNSTTQNPPKTTRYKALVQNGSSCAVDTSAAALVRVDRPSDAGSLTPADTTVCAGQSTRIPITLTGRVGTVLNWQSSQDSINWRSFSPFYTDSSYDASAISRNTYYRAIVKDGVCPSDTSGVAITRFINSAFPRASVTPASSSICYGDSVALHAHVTSALSYTWTPVGSLSGQEEGILPALPADIQVMAKPADTTDYLLTLENEGCPNTLTDTFHVAVSAPIIVDAGHDTAIVAGQPIQLHATVNDPSANLFSWSPSTGLNSTDIADPVSVLGVKTDSITYTVKATDAAGCYGKDDLTVAVFKTGANIFVPTAFTPNGDGRNDLFSPICVGIRQLLFFRVFDRWGNLLFKTAEIGDGWNGRANGKKMAAGGYVYMAEGIDYNGRKLYKKGSFLLIR